MFYGNRVEKYEYELLTLQAGRYESAGLLDNVSSARISMDFAREVVCNATFYLKETGEINYLTDRIRPYYCMGGKRWPLGTYLLTTPEKIADDKLVRREVWAYDPLLALMDDKVDASYTLDKGAHVINAVQDLIRSVGSWAVHNIEESGATLREPMAWEIGTPKLEIINRLLETINYYPLWCDGKGVFRGIPWRAAPLVTWEFLDNEQGLYEPEVRAGIDYSEVYNKVIIVADQLSEEPPLVAVRTLEDIGLQDHPFSYTNLGRYITLLLNSESVDQEYVNRRAERVLRERLATGETIRYNHAFVSSRNEPGHEDGLPWRGDGYRFRNTLLGLEAVYSIEAQELNLKAGELVSSTIRRAVYA